MTVYKRSGAKSWSVLVELGVDANGNRRRAYEGGFRTKREAQAKEVAIRADLADGSWVDPAQTTVGDYLKQWLLEHSHNIKPTTLQSYEANVTNHVIPHLGHIKLQDLTTAQLNAFYNRLLTSGRIKVGTSQGGPLSPTTVRYVATIIGKSLQDALQAGLVVRNVAIAARKPSSRQLSRIINTWTATEVATFLEATAEDRLHPLWVTYATTGLRRGEALGLQWEDIDLDNNRASIRSNLVVVKGGAQFGTPKSGRGRQISLAPQTVIALRTWRTQQLSEKLALGATGETPQRDLVFTQEDGKPHNPDRITHQFRRRQRSLPVSRITLHAVRHTWATLALAGGVQPKVVSENLGHSSIRITMDTYSHVLPTMTADAVAKVAEAIYGPSL